MKSGLSIFIGCLLVAMVNTHPIQLRKRRENQNSPPVLAEIGDLEKIAQLGNGRFAQIATEFAKVLQDSAEGCDRYTLIEEMITLCKANKCAQQAINVGQKLAALEQNFNVLKGPKAPFFCNNTAVPTTPEIRCIVPVVDPNFTGATEFNVKANGRLAAIQKSPNPQSCVGQSVQDQVVLMGIAGCVGCNTRARSATSTPISDQVSINKYGPAPTVSSASPELDSVPVEGPENYSGASPTIASLPLLGSSASPTGPKPTPASVLSPVLGAVPVVGPVVDSVLSPVLGSLPLLGSSGSTKPTPDAETAPDNKTPPGSVLSPVLGAVPVVGPVVDSVLSPVLGSVPLLGSLLK